jgi:competence protein ComEC
LTWPVVATVVWGVALAWYSQANVLLFFVLLSLIAASIWLRSARQELARLGLILMPALLFIAIRLNSASEPATSGSFGQRPNAEGFMIWPFEQLRAASVQALAGVNPDAVALTLGLAIGDSSLASESLLAAMRDTSLTHLVAVSGSNCAIVSGAVFLALQKFGVRVRVIWSLIALVSYVLLVGSQPSVLRAATMAAAILLAYLSGRKVNPLVALSIAITVLVIVSPEIAVEYGFALSVAATAGILLLAPKIYELLKPRMPRWVALALSVSAAAQLLCFPILLQLQERIPTYSLAANLLSEPLVAPVTVLAILGVALSWMPPLASALFWLASLPAALIAAIAHTFSGLPMSTTFWATGLIGSLSAVALVVAIVVYLVAKSSTLRHTAVAVVSVLVLSSASMLTVEAVRSAIWPQHDWQIASCDVGQGDATVLRSGSSIALIDVGKFDSKIDRCLSNLGVSEIHLLVLTHFDQDHVLAINGALKGRKIGRVLVSPFLDERPAASSAISALERRGVEITKAYRNMSGTLGEATWSVLSPSATAIEAEDSNDASIAMLFRFADYSLLALADLGEKGQMRLAKDVGAWHEGWVSEHDLVLKVSHHGSADQYAELIEHIRPSVSLISVGESNGYGHPTIRTLKLLGRTNTLICRTDQLGSISLARNGKGFTVANTAAG